MDERAYQRCTAADVWKKKGNPNSTTAGFVKAFSFSEAFGGRSQISRSSGTLTANSSKGGGQPALNEQPGLCIPGAPGVFCHPADSTDGSLLQQGRHRYHTFETETAEPLRCRYTAPVRRNRYTMQPTH